MDNKILISSIQYFSLDQRISYKPTTIENIVMQHVFNNDIGFKLSLTKPIIKRINSTENINNKFIEKLNDPQLSEDSKNYLKEYIKIIDKFSADAPETLYSSKIYGKIYSKDIDICKEKFGFWGIVEPIASVDKLNEILPLFEHSVNAFFYTVSEVYHIPLKWWDL